MAKRICSLLLAVLALCAFPRASYASYHLWKIQEIYSNATGSVQFIELVVASAGENLVNGKTITANSDGTIRTFTFNSNLSSSATTNKTLLIATPGFASLPGAVTPDYTLPCGPFFDPGAASVTLNYAGVDSITFAGSSLPTTGTNSLTDTMPAGTTTLVAGASSPTNFAGSAGALALTGCIEAGTCEPCDDGLFCNGAETCSGSVCVVGTPCTMICDEGADTCVECNGPADCDDSNDCTDDTCPANSCVHTNNTNACDDGLFCTATDACSGGSCVGSGDPCATSGDAGDASGDASDDGGSGQQCLEGIDTCGNCSGPSDCDDADPCTVESCTAGVCGHAAAADGTACASNGLFCDGVEQCVSGVCESPGDPCSLSDTCSEGANQCVAVCSGCADGGLDGSVSLDAGNPDGGVVVADAGAMGDASSTGGAPGATPDASAMGDGGPSSHGGGGAGGRGMGGGGTHSFGGEGSFFPDGGPTDSGAKSSSGCGCSIPRRAPVPVAPGLLLAFALVFRRIPRRRS